MIETATASPTRRRIELVMPKHLQGQHHPVGEELAVVVRISERAARPAGSYATGMSFVPVMPRAVTIPRIPAKVADSRRTNRNGYGAGRGAGPPATRAPDR
jgi:hypothetical protein